MAEARHSALASVKPRYRFDPNLGGSQQVLLGLIPPGNDVLDVGCASGYLGRELALKGCQVWGIENDEEAFTHIPPATYVGLVRADLQVIDSLPWPEQRFDVIVAADVLEHLIDPVKTLAVLRHYLKEEGRLLVSLPNIAHLSIRMALLAGKFQYTESGILDRTHLHLYTFATAADLLRDGGFTPYRSLSGSDRFGAFLNRYRWLGRIFRRLLAYNIVIEARAQVGVSRSAESKP